MQSGQAKPTMFSSRRGLDISTVQLHPTPANSDAVGNAVTSTNTEPKIMHSNCHSSFRPTDNILQSIQGIFQQERGGHGCKQSSTEQLKKALHGRQNERFHSMQMMGWIYLAIALFIIVSVMTIVIATATFVNQTAHMKFTAMKVFSDCQDAKESGHTDTIIQISPDGGPIITVECDHVTDGGYWTVIHRRDTSSFNFNRSWIQYQDGFGSSEAHIWRYGSAGNHWLGNENLHRLTSKGDQTLHITIHSGDFKFHATYDKFMIGDEQSFYRLHLGNLSESNAGDGLAGLDLRPFSTYNADHDAHTEANCAAVHGAGWWYVQCGTTALTARHGRAGVWTTPSQSQIIFGTSIMMIRGK